MLDQKSSASVVVVFGLGVVVKSFAVACVVAGFALIAGLIAVGRWPPSYSIIP